MCAHTHPSFTHRSIFLFPPPPALCIVSQRVFVSQLMRLVLERLR